MLYVNVIKTQNAENNLKINHVEEKSNVKIVVDLEPITETLNLKKEYALSITCALCTHIHTPNQTA